MSLIAVLTKEKGSGGIAPRKTFGRVPITLA